MRTKAAERPTSANGAEPEALRTFELATAIYISGNVAMESGSRYQVALDGGRLRFLGPIDTSPTTVVLDRALADVDAVAVDQRVLVSEPGAHFGVALALMSIDGTNPAGLAGAIAAAARAASVEVPGRVGRRS